MTKVEVEAAIQQGRGRATEFLARFNMSPNDRDLVLILCRSLTDFMSRNSIAMQSTLGTDERHADELCAIALATVLDAHEGIKEKILFSTVA